MARPSQRNSSRMGALPRTAAPARTIRAGVVLGLLATLTACPKHPDPPAESPAVVGPLPQGPGAPEPGLPFPDLGSDWTPPALVAGDVDELRAAVPSSSIAVVAGPRLSGPVWRERLRALGEALGGRVHAVRRRPFSEDLPRDEGMQLTVLPEPPEPSKGGYELGSVELADDWDDDLDAGVTGALWVDDAAIDADVWRGVPARVEGDCGPVLQALARGQEASLAKLEPFLDHGDAVLRQAFRAHLRARLPALREKLSQYSMAPSPRDADGSREFDRRQCGHAYFELTQVYGACLSNEDCLVAPRLFLIGGARIGTPSPDVFIPEGCAQIFGLDVAKQLQDASARAARVAADNLDPRWIGLADRLGTVTEVYDAVVDVCTPRRRRFAQADLAEARARMAGIGTALASSEPVSDQLRVVVEPGMFHVPGVGAVVQIARFDTGPSSASRRVVAQARSLRQFVLSRALCRFPTTELPLLVAFARAGQNAPAFTGLFYEEELFCAELGPRAAASVASEVSVDDE